MNRINQDSGEGKSPEQHTHIYMQEVGYERIKQLVIHALNTKEFQEYVTGMIPFIVSDYNQLDTISAPIIKAIAESGKDGSDGDLITNAMLDELIRLSKLEDEDSKKKVVILREGIGNALCLHRNLGAAMNAIIGMLSAPDVLTSVIDKAPPEQIKQWAMEVALLVGSHTRGSVTEAIQEISPSAMAMTIITAYSEREGVYEIVKRLKQENTHASLAAAYMTIFTSVLAASTMKKFLETFAFQKTGLSEKLTERGRSFVKTALTEYESELNKKKEEGNDTITE